MNTRAISTDIDAIMDSEKNPVPPHVRDRMAVNVMVKELQATGRLFTCDTLPVHLAPDGTMLYLWPGERSCTDFILSCGLPSGRAGWDKALLDALLSLYPPKNRIRGLSYFDAAESILFVNEWNGHFISIGPDGKATRHVNGEFDLLWSTADAPHETDLELVNAYTGGALSWTDDDVLIKYVLGVGCFSESTGVGRANALSVLLGFMIVVMAKERIKVVPIPFLNGPSGARKTAIAWGIGVVVSGDGLKFRVTSCPDNAKEVQNCLVNARGIICLDEFQNAKALASLLKSTITGGAIRVRILFTTSAERVFIPDAAIFLTINDDAFFDEASTLRLLRIDMGRVVATGGFRSDFAVLEQWKRERIRERAWDELICRLSAVMRLLSKAKAAGLTDVPVSYRMSDFWGFLLMVAQQESPECLAQMTAAAEAVRESATVSIGSSDDLLPRLAQWLTIRPEFCRRWLTAAEIGSELLSSWGWLTGSAQMEYVRQNIRHPDGPGPEMRAILSSSFRLSKRLHANELYVSELGLRFGTHRKTRTFWFDPPDRGGS